MNLMMKKLLRSVVRHILKPILHPRVPVQWQRRLLKPVGPTQPKVRGSSFDLLNMSDVAVRRITTNATQTEGGMVVLYLHGGAYVTGSPGTHRGLMSHIANQAQATVFAPDYRLAPEHPHPAALNDSLACYQALLDQGYAAENIIIGGDSAGGGLALCTALALRDRDLALPGGLVLISPWTELAMVTDSITRNADIDPMLSPDWGKWAGQLYAGELPIDSPEVSPLFADLSGLPPMLVQVGTDEILFDDSRLLVEKAQAIGLDVDFQIQQDLWHVHQLHTTLLKESMQAIEAIAAFIRSRQPSS